MDQGKKSLTLSLPQTPLIRVLQISPRMSVAAVHVLVRLLQTLAIAALILFLLSFYKRHSLEISERQISSASLPKISSCGHRLLNTSCHSIPAPAQKGGSRNEGSVYSRILVVSCMKEDEVVWIKEELPEIAKAVYVVNDSTAFMHPPKNKGHEVMVYLTYIIDNYASLPNVSIFMHAHRWTHHNDGLLDNDAVEMISRLSDKHVIRRGYVNLRCEWDPGCPEWLHPVYSQASLGKQEEAVLSRCWGELFPSDPVPPFLSQPCCAQFAVSKERILSIPMSRYMFYRDWVLTTPLSDYISGRIWEYLWQYMFSGEYANCPLEHACYCDGFGICFGGETQYQGFVELKMEMEKMEMKLDDLKTGANSEKQLIRHRYGTRITSFNDFQPAYLSDQVQAMKKELKSRKMDALERGEYARNRAEECGRPWKQGDGF